MLTSLWAALVTFFLAKTRWCFSLGRPQSLTSSASHVKKVPGKNDPCHPESNSPTSVYNFSRFENRNVFCKYAHHRKKKLTTHFSASPQAGFRWFFIRRLNFRKYKLNLNSWQHPFAQHTSNSVCRGHTPLANSSLTWAGLPWDFAVSIILGSFCGFRECKETVC